MDFINNSFEILNALSKPILVIDINHRIVAANKTACRSFCLSSDKIVGHNCFKITHKLDRPCWQEKTNCPVKVAFELKEKTSFVHKHIFKDKIIFEEVTAAPLYNDQGEVNLVVEEFNDITELIHSRKITQHLKNEIQTLQGFIPICSSCKNIRNDKGYWEKIEAYISDRSEAEFSHSICPDCMEKLYPELVKK